MDLIEKKNTMNKVKNTLIELLKQENYEFKSENIENITMVVDFNQKICNYYVTEIKDSIYSKLNNLVKMLLLSKIKKELRNKYRKMIVDYIVFEFDYIENKAENKVYVSTEDGKFVESINI